MATERVGIYRKYHGPVPADKLGQPLPENHGLIGRRGEVDQLVLANLLRLNRSRA